MDTISIKDISVSCFLGIYDAEQVQPQKIVLDLDIETDLKQCAMFNDLAYSVDYAALVEELCFIVKHGHFRLLEVLVDCIAHYVLTASPKGRERTQISSVRVTAKKPEAMGDVASPSISIKRGLNDLWYKQLKSSGLNLIYGCDDCKIYLQSGYLEGETLKDDGIDIKLMALSSKTTFNGRVVSTASHFEVNSNDFVQTSSDSSSLIIVKNLKRKEVGAFFDTSFANSPS